ncbi:MAG TPA: hypothetical protein VLB86_12615 [Gaiellaceae bacterium]|nr:hypothetical protein [Gaiellaceae bacterium]
MARKGRRKTTPEEFARWRANRERLERLAQQGLEELGITRQELFRRLGLPERQRRSA